MRTILKSISVLLESIAVIVLSLLFSLSVYAVYDNNQVFSEAEALQETMLQMKPEAVAGSIPLGFEDLQKINSDVHAWITVDGTNIDHPVLQGSSNLTYLNKDVYGAFSLAGSIFLDVSNDIQFGDGYALIYGHHMDNHMMFGDLDLFKDPEFFQNNRSATLLTENEGKTMQVLAIMETSDSTNEVFNPAMWGQDITGLIAFIKKNAMYVNQEAYETVLDDTVPSQIIALATCTDGEDGAAGDRIVLFLSGENENISKSDDAGASKEQLKIIDKTSDIRPPAKTGDEISNSPYFWLAVFVSSMMGLMILLAIRSRQL